MELKRLALFILISLTLIASMSFVQCEEEGTTESIKNFKRPFVRRRIVRKRIFPNGESSENVTMSVSVSETNSEKYDSPKSETSNTDAPKLKRPLFGKIRPPFQSSKTFPPEEPTKLNDKETPSSSFKLKLKPRAPFGKFKATTTTEEPTSTVPEMSTRKPFPIKKLLKRLKSKALGVTTTEEPSTEKVEGGEEASVTTPKINISESTVSKSSTTKNSSMIIIPVPPSQRKPYHPVIMQVSKSSSTAQPFPESKVVTYKLNKMFVPMGIYGKVLSKTASQKEIESASESTIISTPLPFILPGQNEKNESGEKRTPGPEIKVKGHRSKEVVTDSATSPDSSSEYARAVEYAASQKEHHLKQQKQWEELMDNLKKKQQRNMADSISLTYDYKPDPSKISLTTERVNVDQISLTTESPMSFSASAHVPQISKDHDLRRGQQPSWAGLNSGFHEMTPPRPLKQQFQKPTKTIFETISSAASSIPGLIHEGLSTLSGYGQAFEDEAAFPRQQQEEYLKQQFLKFKEEQKKKSSQQGDSHPYATTDLEKENLEFFRKRPHLLNKSRGGKKDFHSPEYSSGFKPVTAPPHLASEYYASASTPKPTLSSYLKSRSNSTFEDFKREHLFQQESKNSWAFGSSRGGKNYLSDDEIAAYRAAAFKTKLHDESRYKPYSSLSPTQKSFAAQWVEFNNKYSKNEIDEAKEKITSLFSHYPDPTYEEMMHMKPPSVKSGTAFDDLLRMFKLGISFGAGHSSDSKPAVSYSGGTHNDEESSYSAPGSDWVPLTKAGGNKIISFNAGFTFGGKPSTTAMYPGYASSHFSSSSNSKPYVSKPHYEHSSYDESPPSFDEFLSSFSKYKNSPSSSHSHSSSSNSHYSSSGSSHYTAPSTKGKPYDFSSSNGFRDLIPPVKSSPTPEFLTSNHYYSPFKGEEKYNRKPSSEFSINPAISTHFTSEDKKPGSHFSSALHEMSPDAIRNFMNSRRPSYSNDPAIEIIPSSQFFKQKGNVRDIAAVIKPPELSDDLVKAALPQQIASLPQLSYPTQQLIQNPQKFTSLSSLQNYFATAQPQPTQETHSHSSSHSHQHKQQFQHQQQNQNQQQNQHQHQNQNHQPHQHQQHVQNHENSQVQYQQNIQQHQAPNQYKTTGDGGLGFSNFELPAGLDPDIASLIKTELDKDDIPEEYRKDFIEAQENEKKKKQQGQASTIHLSVLKSSSAENRSDKKPEIKFHKPIPITPTMLTPLRGKPIKSSPVPRYVVELARKLKEDKNVQGIVRVSTKREKGPPIEYLYPVRG